MKEFTAVLVYLIFVLIIFVIPPIIIASDMKKIGITKGRILYSLFFGTLTSYIGVMLYWLQRRSMKASVEISRASSELRSGLNDKKVYQYISLLKDSHVPKRSESWHTVINSYKFVSSSRKVSNEAKKNLKAVLESIGVHV